MQATMAKRVCAEAGCPTLTTSTRCPDHTHQRDRARGTKAERGYGADFQRQRRAWQQRIDNGQRVTCWRCGAELTGRGWHLGHDDDDRDVIRGPECVGCNLSAAGRSVSNRKRFIG